ncbi:hypothetical protein KC957_01610, partial [Candidatus Saccharibacteria bacterium]|nr:hypothetical protein [Candidatus Saccharibacteria bacterium]
MLEDTSPTNQDTSSVNIDKLDDGIHDFNIAERDAHIHSSKVAIDRGVAAENISDSIVITGDNTTVSIQRLEPPLIAASGLLRTAPAPPDDYVQRPKEYNLLIDYLLTGKEQTVAITATIRGAGGFGKTTLAQAICHDERIRTAFPDGILWATIGDDKAKVIPELQLLYKKLTGQKVQFEHERDATTQLSSVLVNRRCLIVIDDVWNTAHLQPFLAGGERCARLVTTRIAAVIPKEAEVVSLDAMQVSEATELLGAGLENPDDATLSTLAQRLGEWPLLLKLVNRRLYEDVKLYGLQLADAIASVNEELDEFGLTSFDVEDAEERNQAVVASMGVGLKRLKPDAHYGRTLVNEATRFLELAIFPEDTPIPMHTLALLWQQTGNLSIGATERLCRRLADLALILRYDGQAQTILLHDVTRHYLISQTLEEQLTSWHGTLIDSYREQCNGAWWRLPDDGYIYQNLLWHFQKSQQQDELEKILFTYNWLDAKLQAADIV